LNLLSFLAAMEGDLGSRAEGDLLLLAVRHSIRSNRFLTFCAPHPNMLFFSSKAR